MQKTPLVKFMYLADVLGWSNQAWLRATLTEVRGVQERFTPDPAAPLVQNRLRVEALQLGKQLFPDLDWSAAELEIYRNARLGKEFSSGYARMQAFGLPSSANDPRLHDALSGLKEMEKTIGKQMEDLLLRTTELTICKRVLAEELKRLVQQQKLSAGTDPEL